MPSHVEPVTIRCVWCNRPLRKPDRPYGADLPAIYKRIKTRQGYEYWDKVCWDKVRKMKRNMTDGELKVLK